MRRLRALGSLLGAALVAAVLVFAPAIAAAANPNKHGRGVNTVVLVHGAWADGSSWSKVIPRLEASGLRVVAVQLPLSSLADDVATVRRAIAIEDGPVLLVAHSYGGVVITEAGYDPKVAGLLYVAAFAPQEGQSAFDLATANPTPILGQLQQDQLGFLKVTPTGIREDFAQDLTNREQALLTATQGPTAGGDSLSAPVTAAAWRVKPTWFVIAAQDRVVSPALQAIAAQQMNATSITLTSSHVPMLSHPNAVSSFIREAARQIVY
jgi:pimeloyl-ACP methyl ester carboxylesterase